MVLVNFSFCNSKGQYQSSRLKTVTRTGRRATNLQDHKTITAITPSYNLAIIRIFEHPAKASVSVGHFEAYRNVGYNARA